MAAIPDREPGVEQYLWITSVDLARPIDGQLAYSLGLVRALAAVGVHVTVLHLGQDVRPTFHRPNVTWFAAGAGNRSRVRSIPSRLPAMAYTAASPKFRDLLERQLDRRWDAVVVDHVQSGWALDTLAARLDPSTVLVHSSQNDETGVRMRAASGTSSNVVARTALAWDARKVAQLEAAIVERVDVVATITPADADTFSARHPGIHTVVLTPGYSGTRVGTRTITADVPRRAVVAGSLDWRVKQFDLVELLRIADPVFAAAGAEIAVIGAAPPDFVDRVEGFTKATIMYGRVESMEAEFAQARLALLSEPNGGGFKLKALDYVFHRVPMAVEAGSMTGLPLADGGGMLEFGDARALVDGALEALDDLEVLNRVQEDAFERCADSFDWEDRGRALRRAVHEARARRA